MSNFDTLIVNFDAMASDFHPDRKIFLETYPDNDECFFHLTDAGDNVDELNMRKAVPFLQEKFSELNVKLCGSYNKSPFVFRQTFKVGKHLNSDDFQSHLVAFLKEWGAEHGYAFDDRKVITHGSDMPSITASVSELLLN